MIHGTGFPMTVVRRAHELVNAGWSAADVSRQLEREGTAVTARTILRWTTPGQAERDQQRALANHRRLSGQAARFVLSGSTPEYRVTLIHRLREAGMLRTQIALAASVVLGIEVSRSDVAAVLDEGRVPRSLQAERLRAA